MGPKVFLVDSKALCTAALSRMSATKVRTLTPGCLASTSFLVLRREVSVRPRMAILVAPETAKACAMRGPTPDPPPVMRMTLPAVESSGREGSISG